MVRWAAYLPAGWLSGAQLQEGAENAGRIAARILPADVVQFCGGNWAEYVQAYSSDPAFQTALMGTLVVASVTLGVTWRLTRQRRSILDVLDQDPDFSCFHGFWRSLSSDGPWEKPNLSVQRATDESRGTRKRLVVFAPSNNAWIKAQRQEIFEYPPRLWRKFILGHVAETTLEQHALESIGQIDSLTGNPISLDCIRDIFSDGSVSVRAPVRVDNGLVYKIDRVLSISEAALGARSRAAAMYAVPELAGTGTGA